MTVGAVAEIGRPEQVPPSPDPATARALAEHEAELAARENSVPHTFRLTRSDEAQKAAADLGRHFDTDGLLLIRKSLVARVEAWLGPGTRPHRRPLSTAARVFDAWQVDAAARVGWGNRLFLSVLWVTLVARALLKPIRRGMTLSRRAYAIGVPNKWGPPRDGVAHNDLIAVDWTRFKRGDVVVLAIGNTYVDEYRALGHPVVRVLKAPVPVGDWVSDVLPRLAWLARCRGVAALTTRNAAGWLASFAAWEMAYRSLKWEAVSGAATIRVITNMEEQNPEHAVKTAVFGRRGGRTVRVPHTQADTPGNHTAFWMYHVVAVSNAYLPRVYGSTWWNRSVIELVGLIFNSPAIEDEPSARRLEEIAARGPVLALLTGSQVGIQPLVHEAIIRVAARTLIANPALQLVVKPKPSHASFLDQPPYRDLLAPFVDAGRVTVLQPPRRRPESSEAWCSAQTLFRRSSACLTYGGSVVAEALALGVPIVVYPAVKAHVTRWVETFRGTVIVDSEDAAVGLLQEILDRAPEIDRDLLREHCDAFLDDKALDRLKTLVNRMAAS